MMIPGIGLALVLTVFCCYHVVRTGRDNYWLYIILLFQPLGSVIYLATNVLPDLWAGHGLRLGRAAMKAIDPNRAYREAAMAVEDSPTVYNRMALGAAAAALGRFDEAAHVYRLCLDGVHADDPVLMLRYAECLLELGRPAEGLDMLTKLGDLGAPGRTPQAALLLGRAHEGVGHVAEAGTAYAWAAERVTGIEGLARYVTFLVANGRRSEAETQMHLLEKRFNGTPKSFRREASLWRDMAVAALKQDPVGAA